MLPVSGWLPAANNQQSNTVRATLPIPHIVTYKAGSLNSISFAPGLTEDSDIDGNVDVSGFHGVDSTQLYGLIVQLTIRNAYFAALIDTLHITQIISTDIFSRESCPHVTVADNTRDDVIVTEDIETCPDNAIDVVEPVLSPIALTSFEACCGVLNIPVFNGIYLFDGSILYS